MKKNNIYILFGMLLMSLTSCDKDLDVPNTEKVTKDQALSTYNGVESTIVAAYGALSHESALSCDWKAMGDMLADNMGYVGNDQYDELLYYRDMNASYTYPRLEQSWQSGYMAIQRANHVLEAIRDTTVVQEREAFLKNANRLAGEALFIRAVAHFEMVRLWGKPYKKDDASINTPNSGIILRTQAAVDITPQARATVSEVYTQVIQDLTEAAQLLPAIYREGEHPTGYNGRAYSDAAKAYLARVYFQMGEYEKAKDLIDNLIGSNTGSPSKHFINDSFDRLYNRTGRANLAQGDAISYNDDEVIFTLLSVKPNGVLNIGLKNKFSGFVANQRFGVTQHFIDSVARFDPKDDRFEFYMQGTKGLYFTKKYDGDAVNIPVIRTAELMLDRAEINAMSGTTLGIRNAVRDINALWKRAGIPFLTPNEITALANSLNKDQALKLVRTERARELVFEGDRLHDMKRRGENFVGDKDDERFPVPSNSTKLVLRIPLREILAGKNVVQQTTD